MKRISIAPSVLAWDLGDLKGAIDICERGGADLVHLDVIDGHFAPNITFGPGTVKSLRKRTELKLDTHLMIERPLLYAERFMEAGSDILTFHTEVLTERDFDELRGLTRRGGKELGLAIKPETQLPPWAEKNLDSIGTVIVMTVNPGFSGQSMDLSVMPKLERISRLVEETGAGTNVEIDGGVEPENVHEVVKRGGNILVAGAGVYGKRDPVKAISDLREKAEDSRRKP